MRERESRQKEIEREREEMMKAVIVINDEGKQSPGLLKFYDSQPVEKQHDILRSIYAVFVETLDKCFSNVCELDVVFNFYKVHTILDEIILGGQVLETNSSEVVKAVEEISRLERTSNSSMRIPKSIPGWRGR